VLDLSVWIPDVLNDVFVADLPGLVPVYQQWYDTSGAVLRYGWSSGDAGRRTRAQ